MREAAHFDEEDDEIDRGILADLMEKTLGEIFVENVIMPLIMLAFAGVLLLIACGSIWGSFALVAKTLALIA